MKIERLPYAFTVCRLADAADADVRKAFCFLSRTDEELSLVCRTEDVPRAAVDREDGWKGFRIAGILDFSLVGVLAELSGVLAENGIGIFVLSTYNTDYILVKAENFDCAARVLEEAGHTVS